MEEKYNIGENPKETFYTINMEKLIQFIFDDSDSKTIVETEMFDVYELDDNDKLSLSNRQIRENKNNDTANKTAIKYDLFKMFVDVLGSVQNGDDLTLLQKIIFNTMLEQGIIVINER